jgi:hypothetical protein
MRGDFSSKRRRLNIAREGATEEGEEGEQEKDPLRLQEIEDARRVEAAHLQSSSVILGQEEIERVLKIASLRNIEVDPMIVQAEIQQSANQQVRDLDDRESRLKDTLSQRNRLIWHWDAPLIDVSDIIALRNEGLINEDTARVLTYTHYTLPYDTPSGESKEEKIVKLKQKGDMEKEREKQKADMAKMKEQTKARAKAPLLPSPPADGVPELLGGGGRGGNAGEGQEVEGRSKRRRGGRSTGGGK